MTYSQGHVLSPACLACRKGGRGCSKQTRIGNHLYSADGELVAKSKSSRSEAQKKRVSRANAKAKKR